MPDWVRWPQAKLLTVLVIAILVIMEPVSWMGPGSQCLVEPADYGVWTCPTLHTFLFHHLAGVLGNHDWVTAIATGVIAVFTVISGNALRGQLKLTRLLEAPIVVVAQIKLVKYANANSTVALQPDPVPAGPVPNFCRALVLVHNLGRTPLRITRLCLEWQVSATIPAQPMYRHFENWNSLIGPTQGSWALANTIADIQLAPAQHAMIQNQQAYLWVFGFFSYSNLMNETYDVGFLARWDVVNGFVREPNANYEYQRRTE